MLTLRFLVTQMSVVPASTNRLCQKGVQLVKSFLVEQGIPANTLDTQAFGKTQNMRADQVRELLQQNSILTEEDRRADLARLHPVVLANNRRVDIAVSTGQESLSQYQYKAEDFANLIDRNGPRMATGLQ